jgi:hypothetical protein
MKRYINPDDLNDDVMLNCSSPAVLSGGTRYVRADLVDGSRSNKTVADELGLSADEFEFAMQTERKELELRTNPLAAVNQERRREVYLQVRNLARFSNALARVGGADFARQLNAMTLAGVEQLDVEKAEQLINHVNPILSAEGVNR